MDPKEWKTNTLEVKIDFSEKDATCIHPHNNDPLVLKTNKVGLGINTSEARK